MTSVSPATFTRTLEVARAALAGLECVTMTLQFGLDLPLDRLVAMTAAVELARRELNALEQSAEYGDPRGVH